MGTFSPRLTLHRAVRPVRTRLLLAYRMQPEAAQALLPSGLRPRETHGSAVGLLCYTRLGTLRSRFLPHQGSSTDHIAVRFAVEDEAGNPKGSWVVRRETSSLLGARFGEHILRWDHGRASFEIEEDAFGCRLRVESARGEELLVRAECAPRSSGVLFPSPRSLEVYLDDCGTVRPTDVFAPEADILDGGANLAPEPLAILELRSSYFDDERGAVLDSAWRLVERRSNPLPVRVLGRQLTPRVDTSALPAL